MKEKTLFFYGKCLSIGFLLQTLQMMSAPLVSFGEEISQHRTVAVFPLRSQWHKATDKAIDAFSQIHGEPVNHVSHHTLADFTLTAYSLDEKSTGKKPGQPGFGITASGTHAQVGRTVAVDPHIIPIGSLLYLPGIGWRIAEDSGGSVKGRHIDVLLASDKRALSFGVKRHTEIYLYD